MCSCFGVVSEAIHLSLRSRMVLQRGVAAAALADAQAALQRLLSVQLGADQVLALQAGQVLQRSLPDGSLEPANGE